MNNECAIEFYQKFGFEIVETRDQYYKRIEPAGAHVLEKNLRKTPRDSQPANTISDSGINLSNGTTDTHSNNNHQHTKSAKASA